MISLMCAGVVKNKEKKKMYVSGNDSSTIFLFSFKLKPLQLIQNFKQIMPIA